MYVLGSWYGNLAMIQHRFQKPQVQQFLNIETNSEFLATNKKLDHDMDIHNVDYVYADANDLSYDDVDADTVIVNTGLTDMPGRDWFDNIPRGTTVVLQARNADPNIQYQSTDDIIDRFRLSQVLYTGSMDLQDPETNYTRFMVIGVK